MTALLALGALLAGEVAVLWRILIGISADTAEWAARQQRLRGLNQPIHAATACIAPLIVASPRHDWRQFQVR